MSSKLKYLINISILSIILFLGYFYIPKLPKKIADSGFVVEKIYLNELKYLPVQQVVDRLSFDQGDRIFAVDLVENKNRIESIFWVDEASIKIKFPNKIDINIREKIPEFILYKNDLYSYVDKLGKLIKIIPDNEQNRYADLIIMSGKNVEFQIPNLLNFIKNDLEIFSYISEIRWVGDRRFDVVFYNGMILKLPQTNPQLAWDNFLAYNKEMSFFNRKILAIDMRIENKIYLQLDTKNKANRKLLRGL